MKLLQDRFEILKYTILIEEHIKRRIIETILFRSIEKSFVSRESYKNWMNNAKNKSISFGKKNAKMKEIIFHCSAQQLIDLFKILNFKTQNKIFEKSFLNKLLDRTSKVKTLLIGNKLVRNVLSHSVLNLNQTIDSMTTFTFIGKESDSNVKRVETFYKLVKMIFKTNEDI